MDCSGIMFNEEYYVDNEDLDDAYNYPERIIRIVSDNDPVRRRKVYDKFIELKEKGKI